MNGSDALLRYLAARAHDVVALLEGEAPLLRPFREEAIAAAREIETKARAALDATNKPEPPEEHEFDGCSLCISTAPKPQMCQEPDCLARPHRLVEQSHDFSGGVSASPDREDPA